MCIYILGQFIAAAEFGNADADDQIEFKKIIMRFKARFMENFRDMN